MNKSNNNNISNGVQVQAVQNNDPHFVFIPEGRELIDFVSEVTQKVVSQVVGIAGVRQSLSQENVLVGPCIISDISGLLNMKNGNKWCHLTLMDVNEKPIRLSCFLDETARTITENLYPGQTIFVSCPSIKLRDAKWNRVPHLYEMNMRKADPQKPHIPITRIFAS